MASLRRTAPHLLAALFTGSGIAHFVRPRFFDAIMPRLLPVRSHRALIYASGAAELVCAVGLARRSRWASAASTAVLLAVFPANVQMALDAGSGRSPGATDRADVAWGRLPLQLAMLWAARQARQVRQVRGRTARRADSPGSSGRSGLREPDWPE
jgi:uncharacterized membrane protein